MRRLSLAVFLFLIAPPLFAREKAQGYCEQPGLSVVTQGYSSTTKVVKVYQSCTVTVYIAGGLVLANIFSDNAGTPKANPFTAAGDGSWFWYADNGRYDVRFSDGGIPAPFTKGDIVLGDPDDAVSYPIAVNKGGTGAINAAAARTSLGAAASGANADITDLQGLAVTGVLSVAAASGLSATAASSQLEVLRRKPNVSGTQYEFASTQRAVSSDFNFPAQSPGTNLIAGNTTITLSPVPLGVNWNNGSNNHYLYASGGADPAGVCYIVSVGPGTAISGAATGTLTVNCAAQHTGAYTITTATGGIQEAVCSLSSAGWDVTVPVNVTLRANVSTCGKTNVQITKNAGVTIAGAFTILGNSPLDTESATFGTGVYHQVTNPSLVTPDFSFASSSKGIALDGVIDASGSLSALFSSQLDIAAGAPAVGSAQALRGDVRVANAAEVYGVFGYVDWENAAATGAGGIFVSRGMTADPGITGIQYSLAVASEAAFSPSVGMLVYSSANNNVHHAGVWSQGKEVGVLAQSSSLWGGTNPVGVGTKWAGPVGADAGVGLFLDRVYEIGDSEEIVWGQGGLGYWDATAKAGAIKMLATGAGEMALTFNAQTAGGNGYSNEILRLNGTGLATLNGNLSIYDADAFSKLAIRAGAAQGANYLVAISDPAGDPLLLVTAAGQLQMASVAEPACDAATRGTFAHVQGAGGVHDSLRHCEKNAADVYGWLPLAPFVNTGTWDPANLAADGNATNTTVTVTGCAVGDPAFASHNQIGANNVLVSAHVQAANTVRVVLMNKTGGVLDIANGTLRAGCWHY